MSPRMRLVAVALPLLALVLMIGRAELHLRHADSWLLPIEGYDPRDPLRGHYLVFRLRLDRLEAATASPACALEDPDCCFCLAPGAVVPGVGFETELTRAPCDEAIQQCTAFVRSAPLQALDRYYIPESDRFDLQRRLWDATARDAAFLEVAIDDAGRPAIRRLLVDGAPLLDTPPPKPVTGTGDDPDPAR